MQLHDDILFCLLVIGLFSSTHGQADKMYGSVSSSNPMQMIRFNSIRPILSQFVIQYCNLPCTVFAAPMIPHVEHISSNCNISSLRVLFYIATPNTPICREPEGSGQNDQDRGTRVEGSKQETQGRGLRLKYIIEL